MYNFESESNSSEDTSEASDISWIESFCAERGHEWFCEVDRDFITNPADLAGITLKNGPLVKALSGILDLEQTEDTPETDSDQLLLSMEELYSLLHARYICTPKGLAQMVCTSFYVIFTSLINVFQKEKYDKGSFARCLRIECEGCQMIPFGQSAQYGQDQVVLFCPSCFDVYLPPLRRHHNIDGSAFGPDFLIAFLRQYPELLQKQPKQVPTRKLYGFPLFTNSHYSLREYNTIKRSEKIQKQKNLRPKLEVEGAPAADEQQPVDHGLNLYFSTQSFLCSVLL